MDAAADFAEAPTRAPVPVAKCEAVQTAVRFLSALRFSIDVSFEEFLEKGLCPGCSKWVRLYCSQCVRSVVPLPEPLHLGLRVLILRHPKEPPGKSSATPLPLLCEDVRVVEWRPGLDLENLELSKPGTWLVYPSEEAVDAQSVLWEDVQRLVLVDSRWKHARAVLEDAELNLRGLPAMKLGAESSRHSCFWRSATEKLADVQGLLSTAECLHCLLKTREPRDQDGPRRLDDLLFFFAMRLRLVIQEYSDDPGRCCPWCTEAERRKCVHQGNVRKLEK